MIHVIRAGKAGWTLRIAVGALLLLASAVQADVLDDGDATTPVERSAALPPRLEIFAGAAEVPDVELATMRGRFSEGNRVMFFGVEMLTRWITAGGEVFIAGLSVQIDWDAVRFRPNLSITRTAVAGQATGSQQITTHAPDSVEVSSEIDLGGLRNASGVGQMIQVTGDDNRIRNDVILDIENHAEGRNAQSNSSLVHSPAAATGDNVTTLGAEAVVTTTLGGSGFGVSVAVPGQGWAVQTINSMMGLRQAVRVTGNTNAILNSLSFSARFRGHSAVGTVGLRAALDALMGVHYQDMR